MAWSYRIQEIRKPGLVSILVAYLLLKDGQPFATEEFTLQPAEFSGLTTVQKEALVRSRILERIAAFVQTDASAGDLVPLVGVDVEIGGAKQILAQEIASDPLNRGYAAMDAAARLVSLNSANRTAPSRLVWQGTFAAKNIATTAALMLKLRTFADGSSANQEETVLRKAVALSLDMLAVQNGLDICSAEVPGMLTTLQAVGVLTAEDAAFISGFQLMSRAYELIGRDATEADL